MNTTPIHIGYCIAYDWNYLRISLPTVYAHANEICLSLDVNRVSWSGNRFEFDEVAFQQFIAEHDPQGKIRLLEENFYLDHQHPMHNEVHQRQQMANTFTTKGWVFQLDVDEYFPQFDAVVKHLQGIPFQTNKALNLCFQFRTLFKATSDGLFLIETKNDWVPVGTNLPSYAYGRKNGAQNRYLPFEVIHQSYGRTLEEIGDKLKNWGHKNDFDGEAFLEKWKNLSAHNYREYIDFHPIDPNCWRQLTFLPHTNVQQFIGSFQQPTTPNWKTRFELMCLNSKIICKLVQITGIKPWMFP